MSSGLFHKPGLIYFWFLNDTCADAKLDKMVEAFAAGGISAIVLHPRAGLLLPYGGTDWFRMIRQICEHCAELGLPVWLYDEDPYPSGAAGGWVVTEHPEFEARAIERHIFEPPAAEGGLFYFPLGSLLWCGWVREADGATIDLTDRVGIVRPTWKLLDPWDSRYYYPATPLYQCARSDTYDPTFALRIDKQHTGYRLMAFVARPCGSESVWGFLPDSLNPKTAAVFLQHTHERYLREVGHLFGPQLPAIFTDEPKYYGDHPWTPGLAEDFQRCYGYDLRPKLWHLFDNSFNKTAMLTRVHYHEWCGERFRKSWLEPVSEWCHQHGLAFVGHISPEDDPVEQAATIGNLFPLFRHFDLPALDLIIPAVGDRRHPIINIGAIAAVSACQQQDKPGVLSESLACSGIDATAATAARILRWQSLMGVTTLVVHSAFNSVEGLRIHDAPPDWGPQSKHWPAMLALGRELVPFQAVIRDSTQIAPVAILWPIRSFAAMPKHVFTDPSPMRDELVELVRLCLDHQVGIQFIDEAVLWSAVPADGALRIGRARYTHIVAPSCLVIHQQTIQRLRTAASQGIKVVFAGTAPAWAQTETEITPADISWCTVMPASAAVANLPQLVDAGQDGADIRCTLWESNGCRTRLLMNLNSQPRKIMVQGQRILLDPDRLEMLKESGGANRS